ncbi:MAG: NAD(P)/FAD-dependent oxidoreductase [Myxococcales bacterium]|nr:NAD(P)/FAD-dependent oxidoreductase [Myxococcales bacterium]MCB9579517.1 NAD(P)/FAD-dependent oxidoreductase [Polyangiaceae bacterium]
MTDPDAVVVGSGPNGLVAACRLARSGLRVLVLETNPRRPGGALGSEEATLPGFVHDVGAAFFPFGTVSPAFRELDLERYGVEWLYGEIESCHPALDGSVAWISREPDARAAGFGSGRDGETFARLAEWHDSVAEDLMSGLLRPFPTLAPLLSLGLSGLWRVARIFLSSGRGLSQRLFESEAARRVLPALALHTDVAPSDRFGAGFGYLLSLSAATAGFPVPRGGARAITNALVTLLEAHGGRLRLGARVDRVIVKKGRAVAVKLADGEEIAARHAVLADTGAPALYLKLLDERHVPGRVRSKMRRFARGFGTFKVDWALSGPVPWSAEPARRSAVVHTGESLDDLDRFSAEVRAGQLPERPYLVIGQQSLFDDSRAPRNQHTLYAYSRVPSELPWDDARQVFADRIEQRIEELAPGFRGKIQGRAVWAPPDLEAQNANLVGGDIAGGSGAWNHQLVFRPVFPYFRYRTPVARLYLCSSYAHPGAGVHGMCGDNAALMALRDIG